MAPFHRGGALEEPTQLSAVGECHGVFVMEQSDVEGGFESRLIEAGESLPGVGGLHLSGGDHPETGSSRSCIQVSP